MSSLRRLGLKDDNPTDPLYEDRYPEGLPKETFDDASQTSVPASRGSINIHISHLKVKKKKLNNLGYCTEVFSPDSEFLHMPKSINKKDL